MDILIIKLSCLFQANPAAFDVKEGSDAWRALAAQGGCFPYDPSMALYPYGTG